MRRSAVSTCCAGGVPPTDCTARPRSRAAAPRTSFWGPGTNFGLVQSAGFYFAVAVLALLVAIWLALQIIGFLFKLLFLTAIVIVGVAAYRAWRAAP